MADEHLNLMAGWGGFLGPYRVSHEGQVTAAQNTRELLSVPLDEDGWDTQVVGARMANFEIQWHGTEEEFNFLTLNNDKTVVPGGQWTRPNKIGGTAPALSVALVCEAQVGGVASTQEPNTVTVKTLDLAENGIFHSHAPGVVFDWEVSAATDGVDGVLLGPWANVGALAAGESYDIWALNPHYPAPTTSSAAWSIQSRTKGVTLDAGPAVDKGSGLVGLPSTAHGLSSGNLVETVNTTNYDAEYTLDATTSANELVVTATFVSETFAGTEEVNLLATVASLANATTTPSWEKVTIDGAWTPQWLRANFSAPADNAFWPVVLVTKRLTVEV